MEVACKLNYFLFSHPFSPKYLDLHSTCSNEWLAGDQLPEMSVHARKSLDVYFASNNNQCLEEKRGREGGREGQNETIEIKIK